MWRVLKIYVLSLQSQQSIHDLQSPILWRFSSDLHALPEPKFSAFFPSKWSRSVVSDSLRPHGLYCSLPGFSVHGILQARILEWVTISFSWGSSWLRDWTQVSHMAGRFFTVWATTEILKPVRTEVMQVHVFQSNHCSSHSGALGGRWWHGVLGLGFWEEEGEGGMDRWCLAAETLQSVLEAVLGSQNKEHRWKASRILEGWEKVRLFRCSR